MPESKQKKSRERNFCLVILPAFIILLNSCIGLSLDIQMNRNGSGRLTMEYRISSMISGIGALDTNASMPAIPVGRNDWERTIEKLPGVKLTSYASRETERDTIVNAVFDFPDIESLAALLDSTGEAVTITAGSLNMIVLNKPDSRYDENLISIMRTFFNDYNFSLNFTAPSNSTLTVTDGAGNAPSQTTVTSGRRVSFTMSIMDITSLPDGLGLRINW